MVVLLFILIINALLGIVVYARNPRSPINILFMIMVIFACLWALSNYLTDHSPEHLRLIFDRCSFLFPLLLSATLACLSRIFPVNLGLTKKGIIYISVVTFLGILITLSNGVVESISISPSGSTVTTPGRFYSLYAVIVVVLLFGYAVRNYILGYRKADETQRLQAKFMAYGLVVSFFWALLASVILPIYFPNAGTASLGPAGIIIFVATTAYAIVRHKLFDIRLIVARSVAYILLLTTLAAIFAFGVLGITGLFFKGSQPSIVQRATYTVLAIVLAFLLQPLKRFFDRLTNRLFYQDAYDAQEFFDQFNKVLVSSFEVEVLLSNAATVISQNMKPEYVLFVLKKTSYTDRRVIGSGTNNLHDELSVLGELDSTMSNTRSNTIIYDDISATRHTKLRDVMRENNIAIITELKTVQHHNQESIGHLLLASKKSGSPYSNKDIKVINIITNELVLAIQNALRFEEIQQFNVTLQQKVDDATHKLRQTNEKLRALDETKDEFISMASHQLRTPLTSVKGYISMVIEGDAGKINANQKKLLDQAFISSQRMVYLIADLLNVSRLRTGKFIIETAPTQLADVIETEVSQLTETATGRGLTLTYEKPKNFPTLMLDETKTRQVIMNFVDNAIYYTQAGTNRGHIKIALADKGNSVEFTVTDDGIGVPKAAQHRLFTKFYRADNAQHARPDGTGLGLFMAKKVVIAQGGALIFHSEEGKGSTFGFSFPKAKVLAPAPDKK